MATTKKTTKKAVEAPKQAALELAIYSMDGKKVGSMVLPETLFGAKWRPDLVHQVTTALAANKRQNRAHTKDRSEVAGGGKKPWKQKGTGQARHGSIRSPLWRGGGITFGPRAERDYHEKVNRKMKIGALISILSRKARDGEIILVDKLSFAAPKTKEAIATLAALSKGSGANLLSDKRNAALIGLASHDASAVKSFRNIGGVKTEEVRSLNPLELMSYKYLVIANPEEAFKTLTSRI